MRIARVFPTKTKMSPTDADCYFGSPPLWTPEYDEIHISTVFTWDLSRAAMLARQWQSYGKIKIGGPALDARGNGFLSGIYVKKGVTITSRGCPHNCPFCFVPKREGQIRELFIQDGNIVQDNNLLACSPQHIRKVFEMLRTQKRVDFAGGLEAARITDEIVEELRSLKIYQLWLSFDPPYNEKPILKAVEKLKRYFRRDQIRCYVLIGYYDDTLEKAENRLKWVYEIGTLPFAMRYRTPEPKWDGTFLYKERSWNLLTRQWSWPAIIKSSMKGT